MDSLIALVNKRSLKKSIPDVKTGDIVKVSQKIIEGAKTRTQVFEGVVISREGGNGVAASITVRKIASGVGVEKKFILNSPNIEDVKVMRSSKVRRKKIFFLRGLTGKAAKMKEKQRKIMEQIGLKEDEVETAETTQDLAPAPVEEGNVVEENQEETVGAEDLQPEKSTEDVVEEIVEEEKVVEAENIQPEKIEEASEEENQNKEENNEEPKE